MSLEWKLMGVAGLFLLPLLILSLYLNSGHSEKTAQVRFEQFQDAHPQAKVSSGRVR